MICLEISMQNIIEVINLVKIRDVGEFAFGLLLVYGTVSIIFFGYSISIINIIFLLGGVFLIFESILKHKTAILYLSLGFAILVSTFIWIITQKVSLLPLDILVGIITGIFFLIWGMLTRLGFLSEK